MSVPMEQVAINLSFRQLAQYVAGPLDGAPRVDDDLGVLHPGQLLLPIGGPRVVQDDLAVRIQTLELGRSLQLNGVVAGDDDLEWPGVVYDGEGSGARVPRPSLSTRSFSRQAGELTRLRTDSYPSSTRPERRLPTDALREDDTPGPSRRASDNRQSRLPQHGQPRPAAELRPRVGSRRDGPPGPQLRECRRCRLHRGRERRRPGRDLRGSSARSPKRSR